MIRSEKMESVLLYFGKQNIKKALTKLGNASIVMLEEPKELPVEQSSCLIERAEQRLNFLTAWLAEQSSEVLPAKVLPSRLLPFEKATDEIDSIYNFIAEKNTTIERLRGELVRTEEEYHMSRQIQKISSITGTPNNTAISFHILTAVIDPGHKIILKKLLRIKLRRNVILKISDRTLSCDGRERSFFVIYTPNEATIRAAQRIVESAGGYAQSECKRTKALESLFRNTKRQIRKLEREVECVRSHVSENISLWKQAVLQEKRILQALATLKDGGTYMTGGGWIPAAKLTELAGLYCTDSREGRFTFEIQKPSSAPPTNIKVTPLTAAFQNLTNVFGVPHYGEINPAIFLMFTFPFLFGAMFGDVLHGLSLLLISLAMIRSFARINGRCGVFQIILDGRYVILLCSLAAIWFGLLYGDFGSLPVALFPSQYDGKGVRVGTGGYPFGIDPVWHHAENGMVFINNLKMKLSLIIGFAHMGLGAIISLCNAIHARDKVTLLCESVPQFISFFLFLGYVVFLCFYKWLVTHNYPSIINTLIGMYTEPFNISEKVYPGQIFVQLFILSVLLVCIPWMFFSKPMYLITRRRVPASGLLDLWISSGIHLVEFGLGLISNTSSYLRLWAVSLAHVQLTSVLHQFTIGSSSRAACILTFPIYICTTFLLLIGLEGLNAALHALRLNWIEFFSKFYSGAGWLYVPYSFKEEEE